MVDTMKILAVGSKFTAIGARAKITEAGLNPRVIHGGDVDIFSVNVARDDEGEYFDIKVGKDADVLVQDVQKDDRHLLLLAKIKNPDRPHARPEVHRFLCGHDERHWFSATVQASIRNPVNSVSQAKQALKPKEVVEYELTHGIKSKQLHKRHKKLKAGKTHRQGEFFFIPDPSFKPEVVLKNEPMRGGGSHFHYAQFLSRSGGRQVYVRGSTVITPKEYDKLDPEERKYFGAMRADPRVHVKGKISHVEHATVELGDIWHRVYVNTEPRSSSRGQIRVGNLFLD